MKTTSAYPADAAAAAQSGARRTLVWDAPVRVFHWLMVFCFAGAYLTAESEHWRLVHVTLGYTMAGLVAFRILWGLAGTRHARFANFVRAPKAAFTYLRSLTSGKPQHFTGHNPAGALAILALLGLAIAVTGAGWATYNEVGGEWLEEVHETAANLMLALVGLHIGAVLLSSWRHRENLVGAMLDGRKQASPAEGIRSAWRSVAALMLVAVLGFWWLQWQSAPAAGMAADRPAISADHGRKHGGDDD